MSNKIRVEREKYCDEISTNVCGSVYDYIEALAKLEDLRRSHYQFAMTANRGSLYKRVEHLLRFRSTHSSRSSLSALISLSSLVLLIFYICAHSVLVIARVDEKPIGIFSHTAMIGSSFVNGGIQYDEIQDVYTITGNGKGSCKWEDEIFFAYKKMEGSWSIEATLEWANSEPPRFATLGLMCRESTNADSKQVFLFLPGNMNWINMHYRLHTGHSQYSMGSLVPINLHEQPIRFRITRLHLEDRFLLEWYDPQIENWNMFSSIKISMPHTVLLGITASSGGEEPRTKVNGYIRDMQLVDSVSLDPNMLPDDSESQKAILSVTGERVISDVTYLPGEPIKVTIEIIGDNVPVKVEEIPPEGWIVKDLASGGLYSKGKINWERESFSDSDPFSYIVIPPTDANQKVIFKGKINNKNITGLNTLTPPEPIGIFDHHMDLGNSIPPGIAEYDPQTKEYRIIAGDAPKVNSNHVIYCKVVGDFMIKSQNTSKKFRYRSSMGRFWNRCNRLSCTKSHWLLC